MCALQACLSAFRSLASLEKSVERCRIVLEESNSRMVVQLECKHKIKKTYHIAFIECETLQVSHLGLLEKCHELPDIAITDSLSCSQAGNSNLAAFWLHFSPSVM